LKSYCRILGAGLAIIVLRPAGWGADNRCSSCHPKEVAGYAQSAMARSLGAPANQPSGSFEHAASKTQFTVATDSTGMVQSLKRHDDSETHRVAFVVGSGKHAFGYLIQIADHLFQSPLSYYTRAQRWDVAPGYEESLEPDFSRPVTPECLLCHSGKALPRPDTLNSYASPVFTAEAIGCERCHGDAQSHLKRPRRGTILNPAKMAEAARDSVCEQCHLAGEIRIPNPGKSLADFRLGEPLENTYTVYVAAQKPGAEIKVVSHSEQLALSACARNSGGNLWCGTCHNPHEKPANPIAYYREKCLTCHASTLDRAHAAAERDCVGCHMPEASARDGGHTAFTDHRIRRRPTHVDSAPEIADLRAWREPDATERDRNLALALVTHGLENQSSSEVIRGFKVMNRIERQFPDDAAFATALGSVLLRAKQPQEALRRFGKAQELRPAYAPYEVNYAAALVEVGRTGEAVTHLKRALELDPLLQSGVELLARVYRMQGRSGSADDLQRRYRAAMSGN
jgi:tetratricopeptide (TPR) repeat protein